MQKALVSLGVVVAALAVTTLATAAPPAADGSTAMHASYRHAGPRWHGHHGAEFFRQLDLSQAQRVTIRGFARQGFKQMHPEMLALRQKRAAFNDAIPGTATYQAAANDLAHAEANAALARTLRKSDLRSKIYQTLTPAQQTQLATLRAQRKERREWRRAHRQPVTTPSTSS